jgi:class 3 adenylate cyclase
MNEKIEFDAKPKPTEYAIAASFDLSGFSEFCRHPNAHAYVTRYLASFFEQFDRLFKSSWEKTYKDFKKEPEPCNPTIAKYTGDGALLLWVRPRAEDFEGEFATAIVLGLRAFQMELPKIVGTWESKWRAPVLPKSLRVGVAAGPVYPLADNGFFDEVIDYAGYCINLAVRLQDHAREYPFLIHKPVQPALEGLFEQTIKGMKGMLDEPVFAFADDISF